jgi:hypothetical protein
MVYVVTPSAVLKPSALAGRKVPRPLLRAGLGLAPRTRPFGRETRRLLFQHALARYVAALLPFPVAALTWPELALPISQAPLLMLILVLYIETSVLSIGSPEKRRALVPPDEIARTGDLFAARARDLLVRIAARRNLATGTLHLVAEQSGMARVPPFTIVSLQSESGEILEPDPHERSLLEAGLFDATFPEARLHLVNLATDTFQRSVALDARTVSGHARLAAMAAVR